MERTCATHGTRLDAAGECGACLAAIDREEARRSDTVDEPPNPRMPGGRLWPWSYDDLRSVGP